MLVTESGVNSTPKYELTTINRHFVKLQNFDQVFYTIESNFVNQKIKRVSEMLREEIERIRNMPTIRSLNERMTETAVVLPLLRVLDWNTTDPDEVYLQYPVGKHLSGKVDIALMLQDSPLAFIEVKAESIDLHKKGREQLLDYCKMASVSTSVLTNGIIWEFYHIDSFSSEKGALPTLPAVIFNIFNDSVDKLTREFTRLLHRDSVFDESALENLRKVSREVSLERILFTLLRNGDLRIAGILNRELKAQTGISLNKNLCEEFVSRWAEKYAETKAVAVQASFVDAQKQSMPTAKYPLTTETNAQIEGKKKIKSPSVKPTYIVAFGERIEVKTGRQVYIKFLNKLIDKHPGLRHGGLLRLKSPTRKKHYFVGSDHSPKESMISPFEIIPNVWTDLHGSSSALRKRCQTILDQLNYSQDELEIHFD